jgi:hypothetical protein
MLLNSPDFTKNSSVILTKGFPKVSVNNFLKAAKVDNLRRISPISFRQLSETCSSGYWQLLESFS